MPSGLAATMTLDRFSSVIGISKLINHMRIDRISGDDAFADQRGFDLLGQRIPGAEVLPRSVIANGSDTSGWLSLPLRNRS